MTHLILIRLGYWQSERSPEWPNPCALVDPDWDDDARAEMASYLRRGFVARRYLGPSICRICGQAVGALELSDGSYLWPEGLAHYVRDHSVRLPDEFARHVRERTIELEDASVDDRWWRSIGE